MNIILYRTGIVDWRSQDELIFYILFSNSDHQLYLETIKIARFRTALCKLRLSSHYLEIKVGLWAKLNKTPLDQLKFGICTFIFSWNVNCKVK